MDRGQMARPALHSRDFVSESLLALSFGRHMMGALLAGPSVQIVVSWGRAHIRFGLGRFFWQSHSTDHAQP